MAAPALRSPPAPDAEAGAPSPVLVELAGRAAAEKAMIAAARKVAKIAA